MSVTAREAMKRILQLIKQVNNDRTAVRITSRNGEAVLLSRAEYDELGEMAHLLSRPANSKRLLESLQQASANNVA